MGTRTAGFDVPLFIQFKEIFENIGVWRMPDGKKQPVDGNIQPVSYTHLDVYKRQNLHCLFLQNHLHGSLVL